MNHNEFLQKRVWEKYKEPGMWTVECVGAVKLYCKERGYPIKAFWGSAINGWNTGCPFDDTWERIVKTPMNYPSEGDIVFWSEKRCRYGHVAISNKFSNPLMLRYVDGNGTGHGDPITVRFWSYRHVLGWFHKKV